MGEYGYFEQAVDSLDMDVAARSWYVPGLKSKYSKKQKAAWKSMQPSLETAFRYALAEDLESGLGGREYRGDYPTTDPVEVEEWTHWGHSTNTVHSVMDYGKSQGVPLGLLHSICVHALRANNREE